MTVDYEQARELLRARLEPEWNIGTFCLDDREIVETGEFYVFNVGAREYLVDGNASYAIAGGVHVVHKADGRIEVIPSLEMSNRRGVKRRRNPRPTLRT